MEASVCFDQKIFFVQKSKKKKNYLDQNPKITKQFFLTKKNFRTKKLFWTKKFLGWTKKIHKIFCFDFRELDVVAKEIFGP